VYTVTETREFQKQAAKIWTDDERMEMIVWLAKNPLAGDVIPGADGARKVRWSVAGKGKRGGARVIYFHLSEDGVLLLIAAYTKSEQASIASNNIKKG